jgi:uncharacterized protein
VSRRPRWPALTVLALVLPLAACVSTADPTAGRYHRGQLAIGTGNTTGVFYEIGAGYASVINRHLPGYEATSAPTNGSVANLRRLGNGDVDLALAFADNAADALHGTGPFRGHPVEVRAIGRLYPNDTHLIVRVGSGITSVRGLRGHRVTTGPPGSGSEATALRILGAVGLDPARDLTDVPMSLPQSTAALRSGAIDAMFYTAGLPIPGVTDLFAKARAAVRLVPLDSVLPELARRYGAGIYTEATIPKGLYGLPSDVPTVAESSLLVVSAAMPASLVYDLTRLLFAYRPELAAVHPAANEIHRDTAGATGPVPLHPGAARFYAGG